MSPVARRMLAATLLLLLARPSALVPARARRPGPRGR